ncbi:MAG: toll/interleukin-1 receptor domain-containing protein [Planctomycetes bacterium]|nr:toll/interleukin-1 receptor domain-containing protein [Planctomycetota bacterium]
MDSCKYAFVGDENASNLRLSQILKQAYGKENVGRFLDLHYLEPFLASNQDSPIVVCLDLFSFDLKEATDMVGRVRVTYPKVVFSLYLDHDEYRRRNHELPQHWQQRFRRYYRVFKEDADIEYEPIVRASLRPARDEARILMAYGPIELTPIFSKGVVQPEAGGDETTKSPVAFISYSRSDWRGFVSKLVSDLSKKSHTVWLDQDYIVGGDDWMDAVGEALQVCDTLLLVLSPEALASRYVKMEYRYFFRQEKPIIPILRSQIGQMPFELATLHYLDFTQGDHENAFSHLLKVLSRHRGPRTD